MALNYLFDLDGIEIDEPIGFDEIELSVVRDDTYHGIGFEASTSNLRFYGDAAEYLMTKKMQEGVNSRVIFRARAACGPYEEYDTIMSGVLNFGKYRKICGIEGCFVEMPVEDQGCIVTLKSKIDQKVDLDKTTAHDNLTLLPDYASLKIDAVIPSLNTPVGADGQVEAAGDVANQPPFQSADYRAWVRPIYGVLRDGSLETQQLNNPTFQFADTEPGFEFLSPQVLLESAFAGCEVGSFSLSYRLKGNITDASMESREITLEVFSGIGEFDIAASGFTAAGNLQQIARTTIFNNQTFPVGTQLFNFDVSYSGTVNLQEGQGLYVYVFFRSDHGGVDEEGLQMTANFEKESFFTLNAIRNCPSTDAELFMIHETLSRLSESITNYCVRAMSSYYGRIDSQPFSFPTDSYPGLRALTSGLKLRNADNPTYFQSLQDALQGLNAIDNIGYDVIDDTDRPGFFLMRVEEIAFFYQNIELLRCLSVNEVTEEEEPDKYYSKINIGYKRWEPQNIKGLDEVNSNREYRTTFSTITGTMEQTSNFVASSYAIETTRQQQFTESGGADTGYDNDTFILCMQRVGYGFSVEQGGVTNTANVFSPATNFNWRITPVRNLMRWFKSIANGYPSLYSSMAALLFNAGTGNIEAQSLQTLPDRIEATTLSEKEDITVGDFLNSADAMPLFRPEVIEFEYGLSLADYKRIKGNPYGYVTYSCADGIEKKGFIKEIKYRLNQGLATFVLKKKY